MRAHFLQHVPFEGIGSMADWLASTGYTVTHTALYEGAHFPDYAEIDLLLIMGGPMSVNDERELPWLRAEKAFIRGALDAHIPTLGVCLGAQLMAHVLGAEVHKNPVKEIGWYPIEGVPAESEQQFIFPRETLVFHWHGETFELPDGSFWLARSAGCRNQAFQWGESAIGLQFHLETTPASVLALASHCADELIPGPYVQDAATLAQATAETYASIHHLMASILCYLTRGKNEKEA